MAVEDNIEIPNLPTGEVAPSENQTDMSIPMEPVDVQIEGQEIPQEAPVNPEQDFHKNLAEDMDKKMLNKLANRLITEYKEDRDSRQDWEKAYVEGLDLLGFRYQDQTKPFQGASGVTHPLLAESVTQFQAHAYKELLPATGPVRTQVVGDATIETEQQAQRVEDFMNYMLMDKMEEYTPDFDQLLFYLPLSGSAFKKVYFDEVLQRAVSKFIPSEDLVVPYYATDLKDCERITHVLKMSENDVVKNQRAGFYRNVDLKMATEPNPSDIKKKYSQIEGIRPAAYTDNQYSILEMHVDLDLDEFVLPSKQDDTMDKNVKVPYIVTIDEGSQEVLSVYRNWDMKDPLKTRKDYFVHFKFLPGLGFYGFGLIHMIGGLSRSATTALRQLLDAGTLVNLPAGFKARGLRIRDDDQPFQPGEFRDVDAPGGNIKDQFQLLPFKEPSTVLYQLMGYCVEAGQRFATIADMQVGDGNQQAAVGTTIALLERGSRVMSAIHKRCYYSMKSEFKLLANIFATYLPPVYPYAVHNADRFIKVKDFDDRVDVIPVADPNIFSLSQRITLANEQLRVALLAPDLHNVPEAFRRVYRALGVQNIDELLKPEPPVIPKDPAMENTEALQMKLPKAFPQQDHDAHIAAHSLFIKTRMVQINPAVYALLQGHISEHISQKASQEVVEALAQSPADKILSKQNPQMFTIKMNGMIAQRVVELTAQLQAAEAAGDQKIDPLVALKQRELDLRAMDLQRKQQDDAINNSMKASSFKVDTLMRQHEIEVQDKQSDDRLRIAKEKLDLLRQKQDNKNTKQ
jgi:hypothetical protein